MPNIYKKIKLGNFFNNNAFSTLDSYVNNTNGDFTGMGMNASFPSEEVPGEKIEVNSVPFIFPEITPMKNNNFTLDNQQIFIKPNYLKEIHLLGCTDNNNYSELVTLFGDNSSYNLKLSLSCWVDILPSHKEEVALQFSKFYFNNGINERFKPTIWYQSIKCNHVDDSINSISFRINPSVHIFAITIEVRK